MMYYTGYRNKDGTLTVLYKSEVYDKARGYAMVAKLTLKRDDIRVYKMKG